MHGLRCTVRPHFTEQKIPFVRLLSSRANGRSPIHYIPFLCYYHALGGSEGFCFRAFGMMALRALWVWKLLDIMSLSLFLAGSVGILKRELAHHAPVR
jgi:hypothetical protein